MHLAIYFDSRMDSAYTLDEMGLQQGTKTFTDGFFTFSQSYGEFSCSPSKKAFCSISGKKLISGFTKEKSGFWGFAKEESEPQVDFIIGVDQQGDNISYSSDPNGLSNHNFDKYPTTPDYLTPVFFKKEVLDKYYQQPEKYSVEDGYLRCCGLWGTRIDNHHDDKVIVWLGDLGRDLPYQERVYWKSFNIPPTGGISETCFRRQILAQFASTTQQDLLFKHEYEKFLTKSVEKLGWFLLQPLSQEDQHYFQSLRILSSTDQKALDELIQGLTKVLIDSLNEKELNKLIPKENLKSIKGSISRLESVLVNLKVNGREPHIQFLKDLQELRSSGSAHRKGSNYQKIATRLSLPDVSFCEFSKSLFENVLEFLKFLSHFVDAISEIIINSDTEPNE